MKYDTKFYLGYRKFINLKSQKKIKKITLFQLRAASCQKKAEHVPPHPLPLPSLEKINVFGIVMG